MSTSAPEAGGHTIANWGTRSAGIFMLVVAAANVALQTVDRTWTTGFAVFLVLITAVALRFLLAGVRLTDHGFRSRDAWWTCRFQWSDVVGFDKRSFFVRAQLADGTWKAIQIYGYAPSSGAKLVTALTAAKAQAKE